MKKSALFILMGLFLLTLPVRAQINLLHEFAGGTDDGEYPYGDLIISGTTLYGMTYWGGESGLGTIFKIQVDGSGYEILHEFSGGNDDGAVPEGSLNLSGSTLFGLTSEGGDGNDGTLFKIGIDGNGFTLLHEFINSDAGDGFRPLGSLILSGTTLYGMTSGGGSGEYGTIFKMETDGSGYDLLHEFTGSADDGSYPCGTLIISGSTLYGMTAYGGDYGSGTVFKMETDGSGFTLLHEFAGATADGEYPHKSLLLSGSTLFGMTSQGGSSRRGIIFKVEIDGNGYSVLHEFTGSTDDGESPQGSLIISDSTLFGTTWNGGDDGTGTIFQIQTNGMGFSLLHEFVDSSTEGLQPCGSLLLYDSMFFGMTENGGANHRGVIFSLPFNTISGTVTYDGSPLADVVMDGLPGNPVTDANGFYSTVVASGWSGTITPTRQYFTFSPTSTTYTNIDSDQTTEYTATLSQSLVVTAPSGTSLWEKGRIYTITWLKQGDQNAYVKIKLFKGMSTLVKALTTKTANDGSFDWLVPKALATGNKYFVRVKTIDNLISDDSDRFSVIVPAITVTAPAAGTVWARNTTQTITWTRQGTQNANVKIQLFKGTNKTLDITLSTSNSGSYDWAIPSTLANGQYIIKITTLDNKLKGKSKKFTISKA